MNITEKATNRPQFRKGLNGNYYIYCKIKEPLIHISNQINKSPNSIYYNEKYKVYAIRIKSKKHKQIFDNLKNLLIKE